MTQKTSNEIVFRGGMSVTVAQWYRLPLGTEQVVSSIPGRVDRSDIVYPICSLSQRLFGSFRGSLGTYGLTQKKC